MSFQKWKSFKFTATPPRIVLPPKRKRVTSNIFEKWSKKINIDDGRCIHHNFSNSCGFLSNIYNYYIGFGELLGGPNCGKHFCPGNNVFGSDFDSLFSYCKFFSKCSHSSFFQSLYDYQLFDFGSKCFNVHIFPKQRRHDEGGFLLRL